MDAEFVRKGRLQNARRGGYLCRLRLLIPQRREAGTDGRPAAGETHGFDIYAELRESSSQGVAVHAQFLRRSDLIPIHVLENCNDEGLLKIPYCFGV